MSTDVLLKKATDAVQARNYDYAIELLFDLVRREPSNTKARQTLWLAEKRRRGDQKASIAKTLRWHVASFFHGLMGKRELIILDCERIFLEDPNNVGVRNKLARAAAELGDKETAIIAYESAREVSPTDAECLRQLGRLYRERFEASHDRKDLNLALERFEALQALRPNDPEAKNEGQALAARRATIDGGWEETTSFRDVVRDEDQAKTAERGVDRIVRSEDDANLEIERVKKSIEQEPERSSLRIRLGDLYLQKQRFKSAEESYKEAQRVDSTNTLIRAKLGDVKLIFMEMRKEQLEGALQKDPNDTEAKTELETLKKNYQEFKVKEYIQRAADQPTNMEYQFELGKLLYESGEVDKAMAMFQKAVGDPRYRMSASHMIGLCLVTKGMYDRAVGAFERALDRVEFINEAAKSIYYDLGETYEKMGDWKNAEQAYGKIYESDIGYRDISEKMDVVYKKAHAQQPETGG